jgi:hypothetical protein
MQAVKAILGSDCKLHYMGCMLSQPNSACQHVRNKCRSPHAFTHALADACCPNPTLHAHAYYAPIRMRSRS